MPDHQNSAEGLKSFLEDILIATKNGQQEKVSALIKLTEIPNYQDWYRNMYPPDKAESWIGPYGKDLEQNEESFRKLFEDLSKRNGSIVTRKLVETDSTNKGMEWAMLHSAKQPLDIYFAALEDRSGSEPRHYPIGYFIFIDGRFRWDSLVHFVQPANESDRLAAIAGTPDVTGRGTSPRPVSSPDPIYPKPGRGSPKRGVVVLHVVISEEGVPRDIRVQRSLAPEFDRAAVEAVTKWRFVPATKNGKSVSIPINIEINFEPH